MPAARPYISSLKQILRSDLLAQGASEALIEQAWLILFDLVQHEDLNLLSAHQIVKLLEQTAIPTAVAAVPLTATETNARELVIGFVRQQPLSQREILLGGYLLALKDRGCSKATIKNYLSDIRQFFAQCSEPRIETLLTETRVQQFIKQQEDIHLAASSIRRKLTTIAQYAKWLQQEGVIEPELADSLYQLSQGYARPPQAERSQSLVESSPILAPDDKTAERTVNPITTNNLNDIIVPPAVIPAAKTSISRGNVAIIESHSDSDTNTSRKKLFLANTLPFGRFTRVLPKFSLLGAVTTLALLLSILGLGLFTRMQLLQNVEQPLAYPTALTPPTRSLSFQGRLTDENQNPITGVTDINFKLYDSGPSTSGGTELWSSGVCNIDPDQDGIFSVGLGDDCGAAIGSDVFSENTSVWLQITVGTSPADEILSPRQPIKAVAYALNSETVQGYPASASAVENTILVMNNAGEVVLGNSTPKIKATSANGLTIEGQALNLTTTAGSNGNIVLNPDGLGSVVSTKYFAAPGATLSATYAGGNALTVNGALEVNNTLLDVNNSAGTNGQILSSTATGIDWIDASTFTDTDDQTLAEVLTQGNTTSAHNIVMSTTDELRFYDDDNDSRIYSSADGTLNLASTTIGIDSGSWDITGAGAGSGFTTFSLSGQLTSTLASGTAPFVVASNTVVTNLNADLLDGYSYDNLPYLPTGTDNWVNTSGDTMTGSLNFSGVASDITTATNEHLALMPAGTGNVGVGTTTPAGFLTVEKSAYTQNAVVINNGVTGAPPTIPNSYLSTLTVAVSKTNASRPLFFGYDNGSAWEGYINTGACGAFTSMCFNMGNGADDYTALKNVGTTLYVGGGNGVNGDGDFASVLFFNTGNVGIGTTAANYKLDVNGTGHFTSTLTTTGISNTGALTSAGGAVSLNDSSNFAVTIGTGTTTSAVTLGGGSNDVIINSDTWDVSSAGVASGLTGLSSSGTITFSGLGTAGLVTNTSGGVLGTTATIGASYITADTLDFTEFKDAMALDVSSSIATAHDKTLTFTSELTAGARTANAFVFSQANDASNNATAGNLVYIEQLDTASAQDTLTITSEATGALFKVNDRAGDTTPFIVDRNGNVGVGVGTTLAAARFDIAHLSPNLTVNNDKLLQSVSTATYDTTAGALTNYGNYISNGATRVAGANDLTNIGLYVNASGAQVNYAALFAGGNVGIGTTAPGYLLDVNGTGRFTGAVDLDGDVELNSTLTDVNGSVGTAGQILSSTSTGVDWIDAASFTDNYADNLAFNTGDGVFTLGRTGALPDLTVDLDGRYLTSYTETDTLATVLGRGNATTAHNIVMSTTDELRFYDDDNDSRIYSSADGTLNLASTVIDINSGAWDITGAGAGSGFTTFSLSGQLTSTLASGTAPFVVASNTLVSNLNADLFDSLNSDQFLRSDTSDDVTSGTLGMNSGTTLDVKSGATLDVNGNLAIADTDIALDGATANLSSTGNFSVNTDDLFIEKANGNVGIGTTTAPQKLTVAGNATVSGTLALGPKPAVDAGTCDAAAKGKIYFNGVDNLIYFCNGTAWTSLADTDNYADSLAFNTGDGVFTLGRTGSLPDLTVDLDGRYLTSYTETDPVWVAAEGNYFNLGQNETITGIPAFNGGTSGASAPFTVDSTFLVTNLNADLLDGYSYNNLPYLPTGTDDWIDEIGDTITGSLNFSNVASDITTGTNEHLALMPNGTGFVGIGTTTPTALLDIAGSASTSGTLAFRGTTDPKIDVLNGETLGFRTSVGGDAGLTERLTILNNGNVGIGTTSAITKLDVRGTSSFLQGITGTGIISDWYTSPDYLTSLYQVDASTYYGMAFVGAGDTPYSVWQEYIKTRSTDGTNYNIVQNGDELGVFNFYGDDGTALQSGASIVVSVDGTPGAASMPGRIGFYTTEINTNVGGYTQPVERMRINNYGNVGINDTSPTYKLDVNGTGRFTGAVDLDGDVELNSTLTDVNGSVGTNGQILSSTTTGVDWIDAPSSHNPITLAAIGSSPNANGMTLSTQVLNLEPASASFGGVVTTGTQTFAGDKTFNGVIAANGDSITSDGTLGILGATGLNLQATTGTVTIDSIAAAQTLTLGGSNVARTINIGTGTGIDTINIGTGATGVDVIRLGSATADLAITDGQWSIGTDGGASFTTLSSSGTTTFTALNAAGLVTNTSGGVLGTTATIGASYITADTLDFTEFKDAMALDVSSSIATANDKTLTFTSDLTAGARTANAFVFSQANDASNNATAGNLVYIEQLDTASAQDTLTITSEATGAVFKVNDRAGDTTPFIVDRGGNVGVGVGTTTAAARFDIAHLAPNITANNDKLLQSVSTATYDTTAGALTNYGNYISNTATRVSGANNLTNIGLYVNASGAQVNYSALFAGGNVGIGTTTPSNELEVNGDVELTNLYDNDASNFFDGGCSATQTVSGIDATGAISCTTISGVAASSVAFSGITSATNTTAAMVVGAGASLNYTSTGTINASSLIGATWAAPGTIGSTTPNTGAFTTLSSTGATTLGNNSANVTINSNVWDVTGAGVASGLTGLSSSGTITLSGLTADRLVSTTTGGQLTTSISSANAALSVSDESGSGLMVFNNAPTFSTGSVTFSGITNDVVTGTNEHFSIMPNGTGNVGIGTTSPSQKLHVEGTTISDSFGKLTLGANGTTASPTWVSMLYGGPSTNQSIISFGNAFSSSHETLMKFTVNSPASATTLVDAMVIRGSGNVGIGTAAPGSALNIVGTRSISASGVVSSFHSNGDTLTFTGANPTTYAYSTANQMTAPTMVGTNAGQTITHATNLLLYGAPIKSTNVALTNTYGLRIMAGTSVSTASNAYGAFIDAPTGATNNYGLVVNTGYVGIGTSGPTNALVVGDDIGVSNEPANTISIGNTANNATLQLGQSSSDKGFLKWMYNATASSAYFHLGVAGNQHLTLGSNSSTVQNVGVGTTTPARKFHVYVNGDTPPVRFQDTSGYCEINPLTTTWSCTSDARLKNDIQTLSGTDNLTKLLELNVVSFKWNTQTTDTKRFGLIAQNVETIFPEFVSNDENGIKSVSYGALTPIIISGMQAQQRQISDLAQVVSTSQTFTLDSEGLIAIADASGDYAVTPVNGSALSTIIGSAQAVIGKIRAGLVNTKDLVVTNTASIADLSAGSIKVAGQSLQAYIENVVNNMQLNNAASLPDGAFVSELNVGQLNTEDLSASGSATLGQTIADSLAVNNDASISGNLTVASNATIAGQLNTGVLQTDELEAGNSRLGSLLADSAVLGTTTISGTVANQPVLDVRGSARMQALEAQVANLQEVRALTASLYDATVSGTLYANTIAGLDEKVAAGLQPTLLQQLIGYDPAATNSAQIIAQITGIDLGTQTVIDSVALADLPTDPVLIGANAGFFEQYLQVNGNAAFGANILLAGNLNMTSGMSVAGNTISYTPVLPESCLLDSSGAECSTTLKIQPTGEGALDLMNGLALLENGTVTVTGDVTFTKSVTVADTLFTDLISPTTFDQPIQVKVAGVATESGELKQTRFEIINELDAPVATISAQGKAAFAGGISVGRDDTVSPDASGSARVSKSSGKAIIPAGATQIRLLSAQIEPDTLIYVTAQGDTANQSLYIKSQTIGEAVIGFNTALPTELKFNWWIVE